MQVLWYTWQRVCRLITHNIGRHLSVGASLVCILRPRSLCLLHSAFPFPVACAGRLLRVSTMLMSPRTMIVIVLTAITMPVPSFTTAVPSPPRSVITIGLARVDAPVVAVIRTALVRAALVEAFGSVVDAADL